MGSRQRRVTPRSKELEALRASDAGWLKAWTAKDLDKSVAFCDEKVSTLVPNAPIASGKKAITKLMAAGFALQDYQLLWHSKKTGGARSGELGYTSGTYRTSYKDPSGKLVFDKGKYLMLWKKQAGGSWKVLFDMINSDLQPAKRRQFR